MGLLNKKKKENAEAQTEEVKAEEKKETKRFARKKKEEEPDDSGRRMSAKIISIRDGIHEFEQVRVIYVDSDKYTLMVMPDYTPVLGELKGTVRVVTDEKLFTMENVWGFYVLKNNLFQLMLKETPAFGTEGEFEFIDLGKESHEKLG